MGSGDIRRALDLNVALGHVDGDRELLAQLSSMFLKDYPRLMNTVRDSILNNDYSSLERAAHTLKGRLAFFGVHEVREKARELEAIGRSGDMNRASRTLTEIEAAMEGILPEFESLAREQNK